ncbi:hypothetical protein PENANT_c006G10440 [Penicillium antarcticum]|uniref:glycogenin glucosyltransferase n=1 Tax=Penicillium antarcticum TaxID=416450 RepID=A0A1V6QED6_9EURO|nr:uncharacterized protein N7508_009444 [Penicillium antarcticum]KAJ5294623.1 hypothetical protein N7508_009444 [Penicillium antarcticum]OQD87236.1 hypothetical protein PENANT_c006G10440 [Penicillium antarcticum]
MASDGVYCTLLLSDHYLPGAMVLAHSLRDNGTKAKLVALFTPDRLQAATINELRTVYDELIPVSSMVNGTPANLWLMDRPDLIATFTKIELWRLTQYKQVVYIDCDVVALRAPDELLSLDADFAAAPDVGWPDCFNSGLMVLRPNLQDYYALKALAERGISFDGADQGLLNMHFRDWHRLSFTYNCTPSANYQYIPAYKHFQSTISLIHFIGSQKPWTMSRQIVPLESPYNQLLGRWWAIYDKHYRLPFGSQPQGAPGGFETSHHQPQVVSTSSSEEYAAQVHGDHSTVSHREQWPQPHHVHFEPEHQPESFHHGGPSEHHHQHHAQSYDTHHEHHAAPAEPAPVSMLSMVPQYVRGEEHVSTYIPPLPYTAPITFAPKLSHETHHEMPQAYQQPLDEESHHIHQPQPVTPIPPISSMGEPYQRPPSPTPEPPVFEAPTYEWDPAREPPPVNSKPEGISLQQRTYTMSDDTQLFQPPVSYPEAPRNMYYQVPTTRSAPEKPAPVFPWESHAPPPTRVFPIEQPPPEPTAPEPIAPQPQSQPQTTNDPIDIQNFPPPPPKGPSYTRVPYEPSSESWQTYTRSNAWDEDPEIQRYIETVQQARKARTQVISSPGSSHSNTSASPRDRDSVSSPPSTGTGRKPSTIITDFPTEVERPSLPVTPAPIHRGFGGSYGDGNDASGAHGLPVAEGVPSQEEWVGVTVDAFSSLLNATYLLWRSTESPGEARGAASSAVGGYGASGATF